MLAAGFKAKAGSCYQVSHGGRDENLAGPCLRHDPSAGVYGDAADRRSIQLDLSGVHADTNFKTERAKCLFDGESAADGPGRAIEDRQEAVASTIDLPSAKPSEQCAYTLIVPGNEISPRAITHRDSGLGRVDDIGKKHRRKHAVDLLVVSVDRGKKALDRLQQRLCLISGEWEMLVAGTSRAPGM